MWVGLLVLAVPPAVMAQRGGFFRIGSRFGQLPNVQYDGRFTLADPIPGVQPVARGLPTMEQHLSATLENITAIDPHVEGSNVHDFDDPELLKTLLSYLSEPGYWYPTNSEVMGLREYLNKGGFLIIDDFHFQNEWAVFEVAIRRVLRPRRRDLDARRPDVHARTEVC